MGRGMGVLSAVGQEGLPTDGLMADGAVAPLGVPAVRLSPSGLPALTPLLSPATPHRPALPPPASSPVRGGRWAGLGGGRKGPSV